jgi:hypothetical protein
MSDAGVETAAGSKFYLGPANKTANSLSDFQALSYVEVGEVEDIGEFGDQFNPVKRTPLSTRRVQTAKGSKDAGTFTLTIGHDSADTGQVNLDAALASDSDYAIRIELDDAGSGSPSSPTTFYMRVKVMGLSTRIGDAENILKIPAV